MMLRSPRSIRADALVRAVLAAEWPLPVSTGVVEERAGMPRDPVVLRMLNRLASAGKAEKMTVADVKSLYWRLAAPPQVLIAPKLDAPEEITIAVTAEDIRLGEPHSAWRDPVCRAVCRLLGAPVASDMAGTRVSVGADGLDIWPEHGGDAATYLLPDEAIAFIEAFDIAGAGGVTPITFTARRRTEARRGRR
jgi:hypothetical protein